LPISAKSRQQSLYKTQPISSPKNLADWQPCCVPKGCLPWRGGVAPIAQNQPWPTIGLLQTQSHCSRREQFQILCQTMGTHLQPTKNPFPCYCRKGIL
jgi:hypothetical protein